MAGETKVLRATHSKTLFTEEDGTQRIFFMRPCSERQFLKPLIEHGGGKVTSKSVFGCIKLAEKGSRVLSPDYISTKFIEDCVKMNKFLDTSCYSVPPGTVAREGSEKSFSSDDSMSPASKIIQTRIRSCKGRNKYTKEEDVAIISFLVTERRYMEATGKRVWKDMQLLGITDHSSESMNTRYRKVILPNIEKYKHEISRKWISLLTGNITKEKEPEFSVEALFKPSPKKSKSPLGKHKVNEFERIAKDMNASSPYFSKTPAENRNVTPTKVDQQSDLVSKTTFQDSFTDSADEAAEKSNDKIDSKELTDSKRRKLVSESDVQDRNQTRLLRNRHGATDQESLSKVTIHDDQGDSGDADNRVASNEQGNQGHETEVEDKFHECDNHDRIQKPKSDNKLNELPNRISSVEQRTPKKSPSKTPDICGMTCTVVIHDIGKDLDQLQTQMKEQISKGPADSTTNGVYNFGLNEEEEAVTECRKLFRVIGTKFGLPPEYVRELLHRNSGYVDRTISWIKYGPYSPWPPAWSDVDDLALTDEEEKNRLFVKYGKAEVKDRMKFLGLED